MSHEQAGRFVEDFLVFSIFLSNCFFPSLAFFFFPISSRSVLCVSSKLPSTCERNKIIFHDSTSQLISIWRLADVFSSFCCFCCVNWETNKKAIFTHVALPLYTKSRRLLTVRDSTHWKVENVVIDTLPFFAALVTIVVRFWWRKKKKKVNIQYYITGVRPELIKVDFLTWVCETR